jgi:hypothetical protein
MARRNWVLVVILTQLFASSAAAQGQGEILPLQIVSVEACIIPLTELGRRSAFSGNAVYSVSIGQDSKVERLNLVRDGGLTRFVELQAFERCFGRWRFGEAGSATVAFRAGTTVAQWSITVRQNDRQFVLTMPR